MAFCTYVDVQIETGTSLGKTTVADITNMIGVSDGEIRAKLRALQITTLPSSDDDLKIASVQFTKAKIIRKMSLELSRANSVGLNDGTSFGASPETEALNAEAKGEEALSRYVKVSGGSGVAIVQNHSMLRGY
jgi:glycine betaine/choline ABC-type transport system substrate-binding protein